MKRTIVIGASPNSSRYSYKAVNKLIDFGHNAIPLGVKKGFINDVAIINDKPKIENIDTVTIYIGVKNQEEWIDYVLNLNPKRIIFNPGTENPAFIKKAEEKNIEVLQTCTLILLDSGNF